MSFATRPEWAIKPWRLTAWIAGAFALLLALAIFIGHAGVKAEDPLKSPQLKRLKEELRANPKSEQLKQQIRKLDLQVRQRYFLQISRTQSGVYLLFAAAAVVVIASLRATANPRQLPDLSSKPLQASVNPLSRYAVALTGALVGIGLFALTLGFSSLLPPRATAADIAKLTGNDAGSDTSAAPDAAAPEELKQNWTRFLGPDGNNSSASAQPPAKWDIAANAGILWKVASPTAGFNSPIVWKDRVFFSGGDAAERVLVCLDGQSGKLLWRQAVKDVPGSPAKMPEIPETTGFAAPTTATDGRRVYVSFANGDVAAYTLDGKRVWAKYVGPLKNPYGHANSLATWRDRLVLQLDQGEAEEGKSRLLLLDGRTGQQVWQKPRKAGASWASPLVFDAANKTQIVLLSVPWASAYNAADGSELWKVECLNGEVTPSPIFAAGKVILASPSEKVLAIRPDGQGDVTKTHVAWSNEDSAPDVTSPAGNGELVFIITTSGLLSCLDIKDGKKLWEHDYELEFHASPAIAAGRVYLFGEKGAAIVVEAGRQYKEVFRTEMPDNFHASPAFVDSRMYVRGVTNVWCLGTK